MNQSEWRLRSVQSKTERWIILKYATRIFKNYNFTVGWRYGQNHVLMLSHDSWLSSIYTINGCIIWYIYIFTNNMNHIIMYSRVPTLSTCVRCGGSYKCQSDRRLHDIQNGFKSDQWLPFLSVQSCRGIIFIALRYIYFIVVLEHHALRDFRPLRNTCSSNLPQLISIYYKYELLLSEYTWHNMMIYYNRRFK